ncbi:MAG: TrbC family F-type conjugative pilus assembly protein [Endozoicomonas sp.]
MRALWLIGLCAICAAEAPALGIPDHSFLLFVSTSLGEPTLIQVMQEATDSPEVSVLVRGMEAQDKNLCNSVARWQARIIRTNETQGIAINPVAFLENGIDRVPALSLVVNGDTQLTAFGVTSTDWLKRQYQAGKRGNIGTYGTTYPISEPDLLAVLRHRLQQQDWQQAQSKAQQRLHNKTFSYGIRLPTSRSTDTHIAPLSGRWHTLIIALDISDNQQQKAVIPWLQHYPDAVVMVSDWSFQHVQKLPAIWHQHPMYLLPPELIHRFQINGLPVLLTPENPNHWRVTTEAVSQFSAVDRVSWLRALISSTAQPANALETPDNPSKALCQSVPILSEKLMTSVPWKELFPIRIGLAKLGSGKEPKERAKSRTGLCFCEDSAGMFHPGVTTGFWRPQRLIELTRSPGCLMALGGHRLPIVDQRRWGTLGSANIPKGLTYLHAHVYSLPLIEMLNMYTGIGGCSSDLVDFDLMNLSEVDPSWNHPELAALLSPDLAAYANPAAMNACTADGLAALNGQPMDSLHWCAGSWGSLYPLSGFTSTYGHFADNTSLLATRALAKLHRIGLGRKTLGEEALCHSHITPWLPKSQYKMSMFWPEPEKHNAHWIGASAATWGMHRHPLGKDDAMYLVWQYRDCCQTAVGQ